MYFWLKDLIAFPLYRDGSKELPLDASQWYQKGIYMKCMVCYYRDKGKQLGLSWLGEVHQNHREIIEN